MLMGHLKFIVMIGGPLMVRLFSANQKLLILIRSGFHCQKCGCPIRWKTFHADHIVAFSKGGPTVTENGQALCIQCNLAKGAKDEKAVNVAM